MITQEGHYDLLAYCEFFFFSRFIIIHCSKKEQQDSRGSIVSGIYVDMSTPLHL